MLFRSGYPNDTRVTCTIQLADFGVTITDLELINTCSYPSSQPNSDPSDCVLIPRDATLKIVKDAGTDTTTDFNFEARVNTSGTNTQVLKTITGSDFTTVPIIGGKPNSVEELTVPIGWSFDSASCVGGTTNGSLTGQKISGIVAATGTTVTCTFKNVIPFVTPTLSTTPDNTEIFSETLTDSLDVGNASAGGTATFVLYANSADCQASTNAIFTDADVTVTGGLASTTGFSVSPATETTYYWVVTYSGDAANHLNASNTLCGDETSKVTPPAVLNTGV